VQETTIHKTKATKKKCAQAIVGHLGYEIWGIYSKKYRKTNYIYCI